MRWAAVFLLLAGFSGPVRADYAWPLERFAGTSSSFGDYRSMRYHAGIDLRTDGDVGWPVIAVADGYVLRASTSYYGYGRALYLQLDDGHVAVYGHLQSFGPQITARVKAEQRRFSRYATNQYFEPDAIRVTKGMVVARTGQTGAGAPHLHFELRTRENEPLNPLVFGFPLADKRDPTIAKLWLVPQYVGGMLGWGPDGSGPQAVHLAGSAGTPLRLSDGTIRAGGPIGFAVEAYDSKPGQSFQSNVFRLLLVVRADTVFDCRFDTLRYESMAQVELERPGALESGRNAYTLYKSPGNALEHSRTHPRYPHGIITLAPVDTLVPFTIVVLDEAGNRRTIDGALAYGPPPEGNAPPVPDTMHLTAGYIERDAGPDNLDPRSRYELQETGWITVPGESHRERLYADRADSAARAGIIRWNLLDMRALVATDSGAAREVALPDSSLIVKLPVAATHAPQWVEVSALPEENGPPVWKLGPDDLLLKTAVELSFRAPADRRLLLCSLDPGGTRGFMERKRTGDRIVCTMRRPGMFTFAYDTLPPAIRRLSPAEGAIVSPDAVVTARLDDDFSGVGDDTMIEVLLDGTWLVPEYDPETRQLVAEPWSRLKAGTHTLEVGVSDWAGNRAHVKRTFRVGR
jgi:hypothetical protein